MLSAAEFSADSWRDPDTMLTPQGNGLTITVRESPGIATTYVSRNYKTLQHKFYPNRPVRNNLCEPLATTRWMRHLGMILCDASITQERSLTLVVLEQFGANSFAREVFYRINVS